MRHGVGGYKLGRTSAHRKATFRNLAAALFQHGQITTTITKAKAVKPFVEKLITIARRGDLHARRRVIALLQDRQLIHVVKGGAEPEMVEEKTLVQKLFDEIAPRYADRPGGYTRIIRLAKHRIGDGSDLAVLQLVDEDEGGPTVSGRFSRRRQKQLSRTNYAAGLRKSAPAETKDEAAAEDEAAEPTQDQAVAGAASDDQPQAEQEQAAEATEQTDDEKKSE